MSALVVYTPPAELAPELRAQVDRLVAGPVRYSGSGDDPGLVLAPPLPVFHPGAQAAADARRAALARPADERMFVEWSRVLASGHGGAPPGREALTAWAMALSFTAGDDLSAAALDATSARQAARAFPKFWPNAGEAFALLEDRMRYLRREVAELDRIAKGERTARGPARAAPPQPVEPAPPARELRVAIHPTAEEIPAPVMTVAEQQAAFGYTPEQAAAALAATNARRWQKPEPAKKPATPEFGGPALHVVETDSASAPTPSRPLPAMPKTTRPRSRGRSGRNL
jgi:hypothetical protein